VFQREGGQTRSQINWRRKRLEGGGEGKFSNSTYSNRVHKGRGGTGIKIDPVPNQGVYEESKSKGEKRGEHQVEPGIEINGFFVVSSTLFYIP